MKYCRTFLVVSFEIQATSIGNGPSYVVSKTKRCLIMAEVIFYNRNEHFFKSFGSSISEFSIILGQPERIHQVAGFVAELIDRVYCKTQGIRDSIVEVVN